MIRNLALALAAVVALSAFRADAVEVVVHPADGDEVRGTLAGLDGKALLVEAQAGGVRKFALADLMAVDFPAVAAPSAEGCALVCTVSGDEIPAKLGATAGGKLSASGPWTGKFEVSTKALRGLVMPAGIKDEKVRAEVGRTGRRKDKIFLLNDEMDGIFEKLDDGAMKFKSDVLGAMDYKFDEVLGVAFAEIEPWNAPAGTYLLAELAGGGRVLGLPEKLDGEGLKWKTLDGADLRLVASAVTTLRVRNGRVTYLSELEPARVEEKHFIEGLPFVWKFKADLDVFGKPLSLGGTKFRRGLGVAASTRLTYSLEGGAYRRFKASAGVCDATAAGGRTLFSVLVDGKEAFATKPLMTRGDKPVKVDVKLEKAKELTLVVDFGDDSDLGDIGGWGDARLVK